MEAQESGFGAAFSWGGGFAKRLRGSHEARDVINSVQADFLCLSFNRRG